MSSLTPPTSTRRSRSPSPRSHPFVRAYSPQPLIRRARNDEHSSDDEDVPLPSSLATPRKGGPFPTVAGSRMSLERRRSVLASAPRLPLPALLATPPSQALPLPPAAMPERPAPESLPKMWTRQPNDSTSRLAPVTPARGAPSRSVPSSPTALLRLPDAPSKASPSAPTSSTPPPRDECGQARTLGHSRSMYLRKCARTGRPRSASFVTPSPTGDAPRPKPWLEDGPGSRSPSPASSRSSSRTGGWVSVSKPDSGRSTPLKDLFSPLPATDADDPAEEDLTDRLPTLPLDPSFGAGADPRDRAMSFGRKRGLFLGGLLLKKKTSLPAMRALVLSPLKAAEIRHEAPTCITADDLDRAGPRSTCSTSEHSSPPPPTAKSFFASIKSSASQSSFTKGALETLHRRNSSASSTSSTRSYARSRASSRSSRALAAAEAAGRPSHESLTPSFSSTASSSTVRPTGKATVGGPALTTSPALADPPGWLASNSASPASSASSHAPATPPVSLSHAALPPVRASTPPDHRAFRMHTTATSAKKLQQVLGVEAASDAERALMPSLRSESPARPSCPAISSEPRQPGPDDFDQRPAVSLLASAGRLDLPFDRPYQTLPPLPPRPIDDHDGDSVEVSAAPPRLDVRRETVDFSRTLLRLSAVDYNWDDQDVAEEEPLPFVESRSTVKPHPSVVTTASALAQQSSSASPLVSDDSPTPTARKPQWSPRTSTLFSPEPVTPAHDRLGSSLQLASSFPLPPPMPQPAPPTRRRSTLVSRRQSSFRLLGRSQSYKRPAAAPISGARGAGPSNAAQTQPTSPILDRQRSLKRRTSARKTVKKQKSVSKLKGTVKWGTRSALVVVADSSSESPGSSATMPPSSFFSRPILPRSMHSFASTTGSIGHDDEAAPSDAQGSKRTTVLNLDARSASPLPDL